ncbi:MAG: hypothetical protein HOP00_01605, partial [Nitrospira sp.]|nr:hypothetical protein [Nitrospira sp.]
MWQEARGMGRGIWEKHLLAPLTSRHVPHTCLATAGFTILEIILVLFLLVGLLGIVLPRISLEENLGSVGRRMVGTVRSLQGMAMLTQKTVHLYV